MLEKGRVPITNISIAVVDCQLKYISVYNPHPAFQNVEIIGKKAEDILDPEPAALLNKLWRKVFSDGKEIHQLIDVVVDDKTLNFDITNSPIVNHSGAIIGIRIVSIDITEATQAFKELQADHDKLFDLLAKKFGINPETFGGKQ